MTARGWRRHSRIMPSLRRWSDRLEPARDEPKFALQGPHPAERTARPEITDIQGDVCATRQTSHRLLRLEHIKVFQHRYSFGRRSHALK